MANYTMNVATLGIKAKENNRIETLLLADHNDGICTICFIENTRQIKTVHISWHFNRLWRDSDQPWYGMTHFSPHELGLYANKHWWWTLHPCKQKLTSQSIRYGHVPRLIDVPPLLWLAFTLGDLLLLSPIAIDASIDVPYINPLIMLL